MSPEQISAIIDSLGGLLHLLRQADPRDKAEIYSRLGLQLVYQPGLETLIAEVRPSAIDGVNNVCPRPNTCAIHTVIASREIKLCLPS
jgi:site-specific DNA recombinase